MPPPQQRCALTTLHRHLACAAQVFIESNAGLKGDELERELFIVRKLMEKEKAAALGEDHWDFYACTLSNRTIVYKGMLNSAAGARL